MSFWTLPSAVDRSRKLRSSLLNRETSPETDMFFETTPSFSMGSGRSHFADRFGDVMSDARRGLRSFPSQLHHQHPSFESLHRQHSVPRRSHHWMEDGDDFDGNLSGHSLQRSDSIPIQVTHHTPPRRHPSGSSRSSTPDTAKSYDSGSDGSSSCLASGASSSNAGQSAFEEHPGVTSRAAGSRPATFTARRQPKVHHIPIRVEPRDQPDGTPPSQPSSQPSSRPSSQPTSPQVNACQDPPRMPQQEFAEETGKKQQFVNIESAAPKQEKEAHAQSCGGKNTQKRTQDDILEEVTKDLQMLRKQVNEFQGGTRTDKGYLYLDEMLTRNLIKLDDIVVEGNEKLRQKRRAAVREVNACICALEDKLTQENDGSVEPMDHEEDNEEEEEQHNGGDNIEESEKHDVDTEDTGEIFEDGPRDEGEVIEIVPEQKEDHVVVQHEVENPESVEDTAQARGPEE